MRPLSSSRHLRLVVLNIAGLTVAGIVYAANPRLERSHPRLLRE